MTIDQRILNQVMLRGCKFRVTQGNDRDQINVPIPINIIGYSAFRESDIKSATALAVERFNISKKAAQAYLDLHWKVTEMSKELKELTGIARNFYRTPAGEITETLNKMASIAYGLEDRLRCFLEDEQIAAREDSAV